MRNQKDADMVPLATLADEGFAASVGELVDRFATEGVAVAVDHAGRLAVSSTVAETMRRERDERERREAEEQAEAARVAAEAEAVETARARQRQEAMARRHEHIARLERASGMSIVALEIGLRNSLATAPGTGMSFDARQRLEDRGFDLTELEEFVLQTFGVASLEEVGR